MELVNALRSVPKLAKMYRSYLLVLLNVAQIFYQAMTSSFRSWKMESVLRQSRRSVTYYKQLMASEHYFCNRVEATLYKQLIFSS